MNFQECRFYVSNLPNIRVKAELAPYVRDHCHHNYHNHHHRHHHHHQSHYPIIQLKNPIVLERCLFWNRLHSFLPDRQLSAECEYGIHKMAVCVWEITVWYVSDNDRYWCFPEEKNAANTFGTLLSTIPGGLITKPTMITSLVVLETS